MKAWRVRVRGRIARSWRSLNPCRATHLLRAPADTAIIKVMPGEALACGQHDRLRSGAAA